MNDKKEIKQYYIYVILNSENRIKIGITTNFEQRLKSLSGSNGGGSKIIKYYCSPSTYLKTLEPIMHQKFAKNRIQGTEWFHDLEFEDVVKELKKLFESESYQHCNELRKNMIERK